MGGNYPTLYKAEGLIEQWGIEYNTSRPHLALRSKPPAPEAVLSNNRSCYHWDSHNRWYKNWGSGQEIR